MVNPPIGSSVCPACHTGAPVRLHADAACAACAAEQAWSQLDGAPLVIDRASIAAAVRRRRGTPGRAGRWLGAVGALATLGLAGLAAWSAGQLFARRALGPLAGLLDERTGSAHRAALLGLVSAVAGGLALIAVRRSAQFRRLAPLACHGVAIAAGAATLVLGGLHCLALRNAFAERYAYTTMPPRPPPGGSASAERIASATVVVLAPDRDGDAREPALGAGAVIAADAGRAWIVTCSHVALPYMAAGAVRQARDAQPVWIQLADGREGRAVVRWVAPPPLDVALVELPIAHPPEPVAIAADTRALEPAARLTFVPNPYRAGWRVETGKLLYREPHHTPAGVFDLLFTDLPVTFGDSGSGLFDERGQLVGLNTWTRIVDGRPPQGISLPSESMQGLAAAIREARRDAFTDPVTAARGPSE